MFRWLFSVLLLLGSWFQLRAAAFDAVSLARTGEASHDRVARSGASWSAIHYLPGGERLTVDMLRFGTNRHWYLRPSDDTKAFCKVVQRDGFWFITEGKHRWKSRPYEATFATPGIYYFITASEAQFLSNTSTLSSATLEKSDGGVGTFRVPVTPDIQKRLESVIKEADSLSRDQKAVLTNNLADRIAGARRMLAQGVQLHIDQANGLIVSDTRTRIPMTIEAFRFLERASDLDFFVLSEGWNDASAPLDNRTLSDSIMVLHDPVALPDGKANPDCHLLDLRNGRLRRVPFVGPVSSPVCFLKDRRYAIVSGFQADGRMALWKIDLFTGLNAPLPGEAVGFTGAVSLSPNGDKLAVLEGFTGNTALLDFQISVVDLATGRLQKVGRPGRFGGPLSWLPDGSGIILKRFLPAANPDAIEPRIICQITLDGKLKDLLPGDSPQVVSTQNALLYEGSAHQWFTSRLDGSEPKPYLDGFTGYGMPAISPDESQIVFMRFEAGKLPVPVLFTFGQTEGKRLPTRPGLISMPVWR